MFLNKIKPGGATLDAALTEAERDVNELLNGAREQFAPSSEFAGRLEAWLRVEAQPHIKKQPAYRGLFRYSYSGARRLAVGIGVALALFAVFVLPFAMNMDPKPVAAAELLQRAQTANSFVPAGKVRHLVISHEITSTASLQDFHSTEEIWLANGQSHLLMRKATTQPWLSGEVNLIDDETQWNYVPGEHIVYKIPYNPALFAIYLSDYMPNEKIISQLLQLRDTHIGGDTTLDGRAVVLVERIAKDPPADLHPGDDVIDLKVWIDKATNLVLQQQVVLRQVEGGRFTGKADTDTYKVTLDEVEDPGAFPADLFTFQVPAGAQVRTVSSATPTPQIQRKP